MCIYIHIYIYIDKDAYIIYIYICISILLVTPTPQRPPSHMISSFSVCRCLLLCLRGPIENIFFCFVYIFITGKTSLLVFTKRETFIHCVHRHRT